MVDAGLVSCVTSADVKRTYIYRSYLPGTPGMRWTPTVDLLDQKKAATVKGELSGIDFGHGLTGGRVRNFPLFSY